MKVKRFWLSFAAVSGILTLTSFFISAAFWDYGSGSSADQIIGGLAFVVAICLLFLTLYLFGKGILHVDKNDSSFLRYN